MRILSMMKLFNRIKMIKLKRLKINQKIVESKYKAIFKSYAITKKI